MAEQYPWSLETMRLINHLTPDITGKAFDPDWFLLRERFEAMEDAFRRAETELIQRGARVTGSGGVTTAQFRRQAQNIGDPEAER